MPNNEEAQYLLAQPLIAQGVEDVGWMSNGNGKGGGDGSYGMLPNNHPNFNSGLSEVSAGGPPSRRSFDFDHAGLGQINPGAYSSISETEEGRGRTDRRKSVSFWPLVMLIFYSVSGGPFGIEPAVAAGGPLLTILGFLFLPLVWSIPEAMVTAELSTAFPEASGFVAWVGTAYGPFWGWMEGYWSWMSGVADNSLYPVLFLDYLLGLLPDGSVLGHQSPQRWAFLLSLNFCLSYLAYRGLRVVGWSALALCCFSLAPFAVMVVWGVGDCSDPTRWLDPPDGGWGSVNWGRFLNVMFWNLNYWDSAASFAGEVENPGKRFPLAMVTCIFLVVICNNSPVLVGTCSDAVTAAAAAGAGAGAGAGSNVNASPLFSYSDGAGAEVGSGTGGPYSVWVDGYFGEVAAAIGGRWLGVWVVLAAAVSNVGLFEAEISSDSFQVVGMAERGMLPAAFARRGPHGTSALAVAVSTTGVLFLSLLDFVSIVEILNLLYCFAELLEFGAFIKLRKARPDIYRPYSIPLGTTGCCFMLAVPAAFVVGLMSMASMMTWVVCLGFTVVGVGAYPLLVRAKHMGWCEFHTEWEKFE